MSDTTPATNSNRRIYTVLRQKPVPDPDTDTTAGTLWESSGEFEASSDKQAISMAMHDDNLEAGTFVAVARFNPRTVTVKPVQQTKLEWS